MSPISWTTGTQTEALGVGNANGTLYVTSVTLTTISPLTGGGYCPANFWLPSYGISKSLLVKAYGVLSTTGTPNITMAIYGDTAQNTPSGTPLATTGVVATAATVTNVPWELDCVISNVTTGSSGTFLSFGIFKIYSSATAIVANRISSSAANPNTASTLSTLSAYYIELAATWGTNSSSNTITCYGYTVLGLN